jgi:NTE family protein
MPPAFATFPSVTLRLVFWLALLALGTLAGCASRPINEPISQVDRKVGYRLETRAPYENEDDTLIILAFSGGGTRAAAFAYGVLEELRRTPITINGRATRLLDEVDIVTGVSGGSFTALAYGLYGEKLFDIYEQAFLKRDVQHELVRRFLSPVNWAKLWSEGWGRSEMAAEYYDEILFHDATFGDLAKIPGPWVLATATDISTGSRIGFTQTEFDMICSDIGSVKLSRAAAASSAVPVVLSPVTLNNYGGTCNYKEPTWARVVSDPNTRSRPASRSVQRLKEMRSFEDGKSRPYLHLVDGGVSDNLGMRAVLEGFQQIEASTSYRGASMIDSVHRVGIFVVNSVSNPLIDWDKKERPPSDLFIILRTAGVPIDRNSYEAVELLKDMIARWQLAREVKSSSAFANAGNSMLARVAANVPNIEIFPIEISFEAVTDAEERAYLMNLPTSFVLPPEAVDRLRAAAGKVVRDSPDFQELLRAMNAPVKTLPRPALEVR